MPSTHTVQRILARDDFRAAVLARDGHRCVVCGATESAVRLDAHHILDRKLWDDGGYYLANGVSLCAPAEGGCHLKAEMTLIGCDELRARAGIKVRLIPEHLDQDEGEDYDHWGNQVMPSGARIKGELFEDEGCQRMLQRAGLLGLFSPYVKFPRTMHLPSSENLQNNDRRIKNLDAFRGQEVVISVKRDGEGSTLYTDYLHARSIDSKDHPTRSVLRAIHASLKHEIPPGYRICGENLYAVHSIEYDDLRSHFECFAIFDPVNRVLSWDEMTEYCALIGVGVAPGFENGIPLCRCFIEASGMRTSSGSWRLISTATNARGSWFALHLDFTVRNGAAKSGNGCARPMSGPTNTGCVIGAPQSLPPNDLRRTPTRTGRGRAAGRRPEGGAAGSCLARRGGRVDAHGDGVRGNGEGF